MLDQEAGLRGFLLSGDERFLEAYERGRDALTDLSPQATELLSGQGRAGELYLDLRLAQQAWIDGWATAAQARREGDPDDIPDAFIQQDKTLFDRYRQTYDGMIDELVSRREHAVEAERTSLLLTIVGALFVAIAGTAIGFRRGRALRRAAREPLDALLRRLEQIRAGDLAPQAVVPGPAEFEALAGGLEETATALGAARAVAEQHAAEVESRNRRQSEVLRFAREVAGSLSLRYVLRGVCTHAAAVADGARVVVWLLDDRRAVLEATADSTGPGLQPIGLEPHLLGDGVVGLAGRHGRVHRDGRAGNEDDDHVAIPMIVGAQVIGVLDLSGPHVTSLGDDAVEILETLALHAATAIDAARLHELTAETAVTDVLTGLPNRRRLDADLQVECTASARYHRPLSFLMVDVDHFKSYNDSFGHQAGDAALQDVTRVLAGGLRSSDSAYRYGGEEFALILRETTPQDALILAERLRSAVEHHFSAPGHPRLVTISIGVAGFPQHGPTADTLTAAADRALYDAKRNGRNRVCAAPRPRASVGVGRELGAEGGSVLADG